MKCVKCGFENVSGAEFCGNCGFKHQTVSPIEPQKPSKKVNKKIIIIGVVLFAALVATILILFLTKNKNGKFEDPFEDIEDISEIGNISSNKEHKDIITVSSVLEQDYIDNKISADEYIMQLAYSIYDYSMLDNKYKSYEMDFDPYNTLTNKVEELNEFLSEDTYIYILQKIMLADVEIDVDLDEETAKIVLDEFKKVLNISDSDIIGQQTINIKPEMTLMNNYGNTKKVNKAKLSRNGNFIVYYLGSGDGAISEEYANEVSDTLEETVEFYEKQYGLEYKIDMEVASSLFSGAGSLEEYLKGAIVKMDYRPNGNMIVPDLIRIGKLLIENEIELSNLFTAMPVFVVDLNSANTGLFGKYNSDSGTFVNSISKYALPVVNLFCKIFNNCDNPDQIEIGSKSILTAYGFPNFIVDNHVDDIDEMKLIVSHELVHHYQHYICGDGNYSECLSGVFMTEATANLLSYYYNSQSIDKYNTIFNGHAWNGIDYSNEPIDQDIESEGLGYRTYPFAYNYASVVNSGIKVLLQSMKYENALKYLYDNSNGNYKKALLLTAERNLTLDYDNKLLIAGYNDTIYYPLNYGDLGTTNNQKNFDIYYSAMNYFYINPNDYGENSQIIFEKENDNLTLLLFIKENDKYQYLYTHSLTEDFVINVSDFNYYEEVVFAVVNTSITDNLNYNTIVDENGDRTPTVTAESLNLKTLDDIINSHSSFMCYQIEKDEMYHTIYQMKIGFDKKDKVNQLYSKLTMRMINQDPNDPIFVMAQKITSGIFYALQQTYQTQFKDYDIITKETQSEYSFTIKIKKGHYDALNQGFEVSGNSKFEIIKSIESQGYTCRPE